MFWLMGARLQADNRLKYNLEFSGVDPESQLVSFLQELLYLCDSQGLGFDEIHVAIEGEQGRAVLSGAPLVQRGKEIKAVTYHNLLVRQTAAGLEAIVVFDV